MRSHNRFGALITPGSQSLARLPCPIYGDDSRPAPSRDQRYPGACAIAMCGRRSRHGKWNRMACRPMRFVRGYCFVFWFRHRDGVPSPSLGAGILPSRNSLRASPSPARLQPTRPRVVTPRPEDPRLGPAATHGSHRRCQHARGSTLSWTAATSSAKPRTSSWNDSKSMRCAHSNFSEKCAQDSNTGQDRCPKSDRYVVASSSRGGG